MSNTPIAKTPIDSDLVRSLAQLLDDTNLTEIESRSLPPCPMMMRPITPVW